ncbi:MAG: hypothetical protein ACE5F9_12350, partial [Phycisphaerae bacterium]
MCWTENPFMCWTENPFSVLVTWESVPMFCSSGGTSRTHRVLERRGILSEDVSRKDSRHSMERILDTA